MNKLSKTCGCVVLNYNSAEESLKLARLLCSFNSVTEVVIVDNKSTDNSIDKLREEINSRIVLICSEQNSGYAKGNNIGIKYFINKKVDYICIANPDIYIDEDNFERLLNEVDACESLGLITCDLDTNYYKKTPTGWKLPDYKGCVLEQLPLLGKSYLKDKVAKETSGIEEVDVVVGSFFIGKTQALIDVKGFDEDTFLYYEENILGWRLKNSGYRNYIYHDSKYFHEVSQSIEREFSSYKARAKLVHNGRVIYCKKYLKINALQLIILNIANCVGTFEISIYHFLKKHLRAQ